MAAECAGVCDSGDAAAVDGAMSEGPFVSVLMTSYDRERYIAHAIESVLMQTFTDFELIVVDDASRDRTVDIARKYEGDQRVRVVVNERNLGDFPNRNRAAALARGRFLKYHDSDDLMYPHTLATMVPPLAAESRAGFALSAGRHWPGGPCPMLLTPQMAYQREFLGAGLFMCGPSGAVFRAEVFRSLGGFPEMGVASDHLFWLKACAMTNVLLVPADLFWYRVHSGQELQSPAAARGYALIEGEAWRALSAADCPLDGVELEQAKRNLVYSLVKHVLHDMRARRWGIARRRLGHARLSWSDWLRYLRPPRRSLFAGTPFDEHGEYVMARWPNAASTSVSAWDRDV
jgi:glycosyltransferase involved in cell wall biosynthesis